MKIAVIGSGIAGNTLVWRLKDQHQITVYEAGSHLGGHTHTHSLELEGKEVNVDSGFIVFNERTYPNFLALLDELGIEKQATEMSFSVHCERSGFEYAGTNLNALFAQRGNIISPKFYRLIADILRFNKQALALLNADNESITLGDYLRDEKYGEFFQRYYILPMGAAIWSQPLEAMLEFPARFFVRFFANHGLLSVSNRPQWYVVKGGSKSYVEAIYEYFSGRVLLSTPVKKVRRCADHVEVHSDGGVEIFDAVFFACHSDQALAMLDDASDEENAVLSALPYQRNRAVLHLGDDLLPQRKQARSSWNYRIPAREVAASTVTYDMKKLQSLDLKGDICVTLNSDNIDPRKVLATMDYDHPVFTQAGVRAQARQAEINGKRRTYFCGAYWRYGFHEDGMVSALAAIHHFNHWLSEHGKLPLHRTG
jgi:uncharacterized protein